MTVLPSDFPIHHVSFISPRNQSDTAAFEFYKIAPPTAIASYARLGLTGFSEADVEASLSTNLHACVDRSLSRDPDISVLNGIPIQIFIKPAWNEKFKELTSGTPYGGVTSLEAVYAALRRLGSRRLAVVNKWTDEMNKRLVKLVSDDGFKIVAVANKPISTREFDRTFESGALLALELVDQVMQEQSGAECIWLAGGAWLTSPLVAEIEQKFGIPVVAALQATPWYCLNRLGCYQPIRGRGSLLELTM